MEPSHFDLLVVLTVFGAFGLTVLTILGWMAWDTHRSVKEGQRLTRAVAGLVVQESDRIRALMRD